MSIERIESTENTETSPLEVRLGAALRAAGKTLAAAESSTGGLITQRLTAIPGSSAYVIGGVVVYADSAKQKLLGVQTQTLIDHGAVSEPVALEMADGARALFDTDLALSVTGIAGPTGATATKPVGLHFIGLSAANGSWVRRFVWDYDRAGNRAAAAEAAMTLALDYVEGRL